MNKPPAFQFYAKDFISDAKVQLMSNECVGIYIKLLCYDWNEDGIPDQPILWANLVGYPTNTPDAMASWKVCAGILRRLFIKHPRKSGFVTNLRLQSERRQLTEYRKQQQANALHRWKKPMPSHSRRITKALPSSCSSTSTASSIKTPLNSPEAFIEGLKTNPAYKNIDVSKELNKMDAWISAHKGRQRTKRFIVNWLNKAADQASTSVPAGPKPPALKSCFVCGHGKQVLESEWAAHWQTHEDERLGKSPSTGGLVKGLAEKLGANRK